MRIPNRFPLQSLSRRRSATHRRSNGSIARSSLLALLSVTFASIGVSQADEVKLKSGETIVGRITYEADDIIKVEVSVTESIKETKIISRAEIEEITKEAPDAVEFANLQKLLPMPSLSSAEAYRQAIASGPGAFLRRFPESELRPKVEEIRDTLAEELEKVERGYLKLEDDWVSPQDKIDFKELVDSRIRFLRMEALAKAENTNSLISAMREFEQLEKTYLGTPAFVRAVELALQAIPILGRQLQGLQRDVDFRNAEYQKGLEASSPDARLHIANARAAEEQAHQEGVAAEKKAGIKWVRLDPRNRASIEELLKLASSELTRIRTYDLAQLKEQSEKLEEVDRLIAAKDMQAARTKLTEAAAISGQKVDTASKSKAKSSTAPGSYIAALLQKIGEYDAEQQATAKAKADAARSEALAANIQKSGTKAPGPDADTPEDPEPATPKDSQPGPDETPEKKPEVDEFRALAGAKKSTSTKAPPEEKTGDKAKAKDSSREDRTDETSPQAVADDDDGGFPFGLVIPILTGLILVTVVVLKVLGIGGKKEAVEEA